MFESEETKREAGNPDREVRNPHRLRWGGRQSYYQSYIDYPKEYRQQELTALFWFSLNSEWESMQPDMIAFQKEFNSFGEPDA